MEAGGPAREKKESSVSATEIGTARLCQRVDGLTEKISRWRYSIEPAAVTVAGGVASTNGRKGRGRVHFGHLGGAWGLIYNLAQLMAAFKDMKIYTTLEKHTLQFVFSFFSFLFNYCSRIFYSTVSARVVVVVVGSR